MPEKKLKFYDLKAKKPFHSTKYKIVMKGKRKFAVAESPSGGTSWRILGTK